MVKYAPETITQACRSKGIKKIKEVLFIYEFPFGMVPQSKLTFPI